MRPITASRLPRALRQLRSPRAAASDVVTVNATALAENTTLTLAGSAAETVTGLVGNLAAGSLTGALSVTTGDATDNSISITTGSAATSVTANGASDTVTVDATTLANNTTLTLVGSAAEMVTGLIGNIAAGSLDRGADRDHGRRHRQHDCDHHRLGRNLDHR